MGLLNKRYDSDEEKDDPRTEETAETTEVPEAGPADDEWKDPLADEIAALRAEVAALTGKLEAAVTSKEAMKAMMAEVSRRDAEMANKKLMSMLDAMAAMREDFFKLSAGIREKVSEMDAKAVLDSFDAYNVDMENILLDCGVEIGPAPYDKLNTINQRIVDVVPTDDPEKDGMIAERISDGYRYNGRVLYKERVNVYKFAEENKDCNKE